MTVNSVPGGKLAGHKRRAGRRTDRTVDIELREQGSLTGQSVEMGRFDRGFAVASEVSGHVFDNNPEDIRTYPSALQSC